jgi:hypothetical protein
MSRLSVVYRYPFELEATPPDVERLVGVKAAVLGTRGDPVRPGVATILKRSCAVFSLEFNASVRLDEMVPAILSHVGGVDHICSVRDQIAPEYFEVGVTLPVKGSEEQEGGFISTASIADLCRIEATLSFGFY